jgi:hypothetical protein
MVDDASEQGRHRALYELMVNSAILANRVWADEGKRRGGQNRGELFRRIKAMKQVELLRRYPEWVRLRRDPSTPSLFGVELAAPVRIRDIDGASRFATDVGHLPEVEARGWLTAQEIRRMEGGSDQDSQRPARTSEARLRRTAAPAAVIAARDSE